MDELVVVALGGNAIKTADEKGTTEEQFSNVDKAAKEIVRICKAGYLQVLTHGNGPQAGALLIQQENAKHLVPPQTMACCTAMTQGQIGWMLQNRVSYWMSREGLPYPVSTLITQSIVSKDDPAFNNPDKPVGPFYTKTEALQLQNEKNYTVKQVNPDSDMGWRRVVPSPVPIDILEGKAIKSLLEIEALVIVSGGGGIPIVKTADGSFDGIDAVVDKDRTAFKLGEILDADYLLILTEVEKVYLNFNKPDQKPLDTVSVREAQAYLSSGYFGAGTMAPKVEAAIAFAKTYGKKAIITCLDKALDALKGLTGTHIQMDDQDNSLETDLSSLENKIFNLG